MIFEIIRGGETDWVGKERAGLLFPQGKNGPAHSFRGEKLTGGKFRPGPGEKVCISPEALMSQLDHWSPNDVCLEKRGYAASICLAQVTWRIALVSI